MRIKIRVKAGAPKDGFQGTEQDGTIKVAISARPVDGKANEALVRFLAKAFGLPPGEVRITSGARSRMKVIELPGITPEKLSEVTR